MYEWHPQPKQEFALKISLDVFEILFGGSRGGGKTDTGIVWLTDCIENPQYRALVIRRSYKDLTDWQDRAGYLYRRYGAEIIGNPAEIRWPSGAKFRLGHLNDRNSYEQYLGHEYQRLLIEELTQIPREEDYVKILGSVRSTIDGIKPQVFLTTNPTGAGHAWVKQRFVNHLPHGKPFDAGDGRKRIYIPATVDDNPILSRKDPSYLLYLEGLKASQPELYKAWRLGSWDVFIGQMFQEWNLERHVVSSFEYPIHQCPRIIGFDWGYNDPACAIWLAYTPDMRVYAYRERYYNQMAPGEWAEMINDFTKVEEVKYLLLPPDCFTQMYGGKSIAQTFKEAGIPIRPLGGGVARLRINRWAMLHQYLSDAPDGLPYLQIHESCKNLIRTIPEMVYSETKPEDIEDGQEDHALDALTYGLISKATFANVGGVIRPVLGKSTPRSFEQTATGEMVSPDFWKAMANPKPTTSSSIEFKS